MTLFLCGDVVIGRGIDQIQPHPDDPELHESYVRDAREYVALAEGANGPIPYPVDPEYIWGDALAELDRMGPNARIINLETAITTSAEYWKGKGIHYRMHPANVDCLAKLRVDVCALRNNHILDWGYSGLDETLAVLDAAAIRAVGAGHNATEAACPAARGLPNGGRLLVWSVGDRTSGIPSRWSATAIRPGVDFLRDLSKKSAIRLLERIQRARQSADRAVVSIHWGSNWGYDVPDAQTRFAHWLIDGGVDIVHGHSSHHPRPVEVYRNKLALYGCGDLLNDYEGISGYEEYRSHLVLMYFVEIDRASGDLVGLRMTPMRIAKMRLNHVSDDEATWLASTLDRVSARFGSHVSRATDGRLMLA